MQPSVTILGGRGPFYTYVRLVTALARCAVGRALASQPGRARLRFTARHGTARRGAGPACGQPSVGSRTVRRALLIGCVWCPLVAAMNCTAHNSAAKSTIIILLQSAHRLPGEFLFGTFDAKSTLLYTKSVTVIVDGKRNNLLCPSKKSPFL